MAHETEIFATIQSILSSTDYSNQEIQINPELQELFNIPMQMMFRNLSRDYLTRENETLDFRVIPSNQHNQINDEFILATSTVLNDTENHVNSLIFPRLERVTREGIDFLENLLRTNHNIRTIRIGNDIFLGNNLENSTATQQIQNDNQRSAPDNIPSNTTATRVEIYNKPIR